jgi:hypothetical protein
VYRLTLLFVSVAGFIALRHWWFFLSGGMLDVVFHNRSIIELGWELPDTSVSFTIATVLQMLSLAHSDLRYSTKSVFSAAVNPNENTAL